MYMITEELVQNILQTEFNKIPLSVREHGKKSILNWLGVAIGAVNHSSVDMLLKVFEENGYKEQASVLGKNLKLNTLQAVMVNGMSSHIFDFDDTHLDTINHPSGPVAPVVFALGELYNIEATKLLKAFILGCEASLRISNAVYPSHYLKGWHITSSTGVFGAAVAAGILLDLSEKEMKYALGIAGTQSFGLREMFGTMTKPFHPGKAAYNGLFAALLAKEGFTSSERVLEAKRGFANVLAPNYDLNKVNINWGSDWELLKNAFKPYACGIVLHPSIDACIELGKQVAVEEVKSLELYVNPYVIELTGKKEPQTGLEGKFSIYHTASIAFLDGDGGELQYSDEKVNDPDVIQFRKKIKPIIDDDMTEERVKARLIKNNGETIQIEIENATGSIENPMTLEHLTRKFHILVEPILGKTVSESLVNRINNFENESITDIAKETAGV